MLQFSLLLALLIKYLFLAWYECLLLSHRHRYERIDYWRISFVLQWDLGWQLVHLVDLLNEVISAVLLLLSYLVLPLNFAVLLGSFRYSNPSLTQCNNLFFYCPFGHLLRKELLCRIGLDCRGHNWQLESIMFVVLVHHQYLFVGFCMHLQKLLLECLAHRQRQPAFLHWGFN